MKRIVYCVVFLLLVSLVVYQFEAQLQIKFVYANDVLQEKEEDPNLKLTIYVLNASMYNACVYPYEVPSKCTKECHRFVWILKVTKPYFGETAYLQFSYDNITWWDFPNATVQVTVYGNENFTVQGNWTIDASWAKGGMNYLRFQVAGNRSNIVSLAVNTNTMFWIANYQLYLFLGSVVLMAVLVFWEKKRRKLRFSAVGVKNVSPLPRVRMFFTCLRERLTTFKLLLNPKLGVPLIIGTLIRLSLAPLTEQRWDMYIWRLHQVFVYGYHKNPFWLGQGVAVAPIEQAFCWSYTPLWLFTLLLVYPIYALISPTSLINDPRSLWAFTWNPYDPNSNMFEAYHSFVPLNLPLLNLLTKIPVIIADILIAFLLYKIIVSIFNEKNAMYAYYAWLFNPYTLWISSIWGMFDQIPILFVLLSLVALVKKKYKASALLLSTAVLFKIYPILLVPVFALISYKQTKKFRNAVKYCVISGVFIFLVVFMTCFTFALASGQEPVTVSIRVAVGLLRGRSSPDWEGHNIISGMTPLIVLQNVFGNLGLNNVPVSPILMSMALFFVLIKMYRKESFSRDDIFSYTVVTHLVIYLTYTVVNPQHLTWVLPFILVLGVERKSSPLKYFYWIVSIIGLLYVIQSQGTLSYWVSPYFLPGCLDIPPSVYIQPIVLAVAIAALYIVGIKLSLKKR